MRGALTGLLCACAVSCALPMAAAAAKPARAPSPAQVRRAVRAAERSKNLWATVNICDTAAYRHTLGVRGQMPALGFPADLRMTFKLDYFSAAKHTYVPLAGVADELDLGSAAKGTYQGGVRFAFKPHSGRLRGRVVFTWRYRGRTIGQMSEFTTAGHRGARYGDPRGYSRASCTIA